jgi:cytochrome c oxidase subunit 4
MRTAVATFVALLVLTTATVAAAYVDLGALSTVVALAIAGVKAAIVALWFMHLRGSGRVVWLTALAGVAWLALLIVLLMADFATRGLVPPAS